ncbi:brefeldin A-inhibited guanine nucleotide-exchange protein 3 isoform X2 [Oratosquilla oratoria]|uniref:brefeldin A-inhibited guanine nucleotide-exchange protein 3 isoform X2 n=1 Tax=Oratosquilla oratoria TaxID=337810 RepID=UPI003F757678
MEEVLDQIIRESSNSKFQLIRHTAVDARGLLESQAGLLRCPPHELRSKCLNAIQAALETKYSKLVTLAVAGCHKILRDSQFHSAYEEEDETTWLASQFLGALQSLPLHGEDAQVDIVKVLLSMSCVPGVSLSGHIVTHIVGVCGAAYGRGGAALRTASLAAASQAILHLIQLLKEESVEQERQNPRKFSKESDEKTTAGETGEDESDFIAPAYDELVPVINFIANKLTEINKHQDDKRPPEIPSVYLLECSHTLLSALALPGTSGKPINAQEALRKGMPSALPACNPALLNYAAPPYCSTLLVGALWQRLCPSLVALLGSPASDRLARSSGRIDGQMGRGSGCMAHPASLFNNQQARAIYNVSCSLVITMGVVGEMRPVLESLFHRMLLYPPPKCRYEALRAVLELMSSPERLVQLAGPILHIDPRNPHQNDLALFRLVMDSLGECGNCGESSVQIMATDCVTALLSSLEQLCCGTSLSQQHIHAINTAYARLDAVDYSGPLTYENKSKLPKYEVTEDLKLCDSVSVSAESNSQSTDLEELEKLEDDDQTSLSLNGKGKRRVKETRLKLKGKEVKHSEGEAEEENEEEGSDSSGDTEGPEEGYDDDTGEFSLEAEKLREEEEAFRLHKLNETLSSSSNIRMVQDEESEAECENARHFISTLQAILPSMLAIRSTIEVDQAMQEFASKYCEGVFSESEMAENFQIIINADGIYLATYTALSLNLKLIKNGNYCDPNLPLCMTQEQFVASVHGSGVLVYLSSTWLAEVFRQVTRDSLLQRAGYNPHSPHNCALINLLSDLDGLGSTEQGSQFLSDHRRLEKAASNVTHSAEVLAGMKLARRILTCCWESVVAILGVVIGNKGNGVNVLKTPLRYVLNVENVWEETRKAQELLSQCLKALQSAARLSNILGLQNRCGIVFSLLSSASLPREKFGIGSSVTQLTTPSRRLAAPTVSKKSQRLHNAHLLSIHVMMSAGLELGSHAPDCWAHVFRCCIYLSELEHKFFSQSSSYQTFPRITTSPVKSERKDSKSSDDLFSDDLYSYMAPISPVTPNIDIEQLVKDSQLDSNSNGFLSPQHTAKAICALSQQVDRLFDDAATKLNLSALLSFLTELCAASQAQLFSKMTKEKPRKGMIRWPKKKEPGEGNSSQGDLLLLQRLGEVMLRAVRSGRPLVHIMKAWAIAGPHFMEATCHKDGTVSKRAVTCIHDIVNSLLSNQSELPHFHFNEALFKPFENLLCLELCDVDVQDQIVSSICEFVESCTPEIRSGWRPLFGALRCVKAPSSFSMAQPTTGVAGLGSSKEGLGHMHVVKDVFEAFLATDNVLVFANAALDCILCLLKHVKGTGDVEISDETVVGWGELVAGDLCIDALRYLHRCAAVLTSMFEMPACPVFHSAHRITLNSPPQLVDAHLANVDESIMWDLMEEVLDHNYKVPYEKLWPQQTAYEPLCLAALDKGSGLLNVWYVLLEGLAGATMTCPRRYQPQVLDALFTLLCSLPDSPGPEFGMYCVNHLLLPLMQGWLRRTSSTEISWDFSSSFKQHAGFTTDLVVGYISKMSDTGTLETSSSGRLMLQQSILVLIECITHSNETISRLGCSCIRHLVSSCGKKLPPSYWDIVVSGLHRSCQVSLYPLYQLMRLFTPDSPNFYGDVGQVKVAARRDCTGRDSDRLKQLSHQVFLLDTQRSDVTGPPDNPDSEDRSFIFLLYPNGPPDDGSTTCESLVRVPFRSLVVGLLAHQILLQTLGTVLLQGSVHIIPSLANVLLQGMDFTCEESKDGHVAECRGKLPGLMPNMTHTQIHTLLDSLHVSYKAAVEFDSRPGLKFLIQKVAQAERAANLYKQAGASWTLRMVTLFDLTLAQVTNGLDLEGVKNVLDQDVKTKNTVRRDPQDGQTLDAGAYENHDIVTNTVEKKERPTQLFQKETSEYIQMLKDSFSELCERYLDLIIDKDGHYSAMDKISDQPLFFLTVQPDEFPTAHRKSLAQWSESVEAFNKRFEKKMKDKENENEEIPAEDGEASTKPEEPQDYAVEEKSETSERRPFTFADLAREYSTDSDDSEVPEFAEGGDSGVASLAGYDHSVYKVATEKDIASMITDYRRRKNHHSLPSMHREKRVNPFLEKKSIVKPLEDVPPDIEEQRSASILKDSEAHTKVWTEMVVTVFDLISQLGDSELRPLLPLVFPTMRTLTAHAHDAHLRQVVAELLTRVATLYGFSPAE